jgi:hypothetical protein
MATVSTLIPLEATAIDQAMLLLTAAGTDEPFRPTSLLKSGLALLLGAVEVHELGQRHPWLKLDAVGRHDWEWYLRAIAATAWGFAEPST